MRSSRLATRTAAFGESIFAEISALAHAHQALDLGQGYPDFSPPEFVVAAAAKHAAGARHQYAPLSGMPQLARRLASCYRARLGREIDPKREITITAGATEGLYAAIMALVEPGDEVILIDPVYDAYPANVALAGATPQFVPLRWRDGRFQLDPDELTRAFGPRTKLIVLNTPHNPTGKVFDAADLQHIADLCIEHDVFCVSDEVYDEMLFDGRRHLHLAALPGMAERTLTIGSAGKTFSVTGWKIGWVVAPAELSTGVRRIHQWLTFTVSTPMQLAIADALEHAEATDYYMSLKRDYQQRRDVLVAALSEAGLDPRPPEGTYFVTADVSPFDADGARFCQTLIEKMKLAAIPAGVFYSPGHRALGKSLVRFCFAKDITTIERARQILLQTRATFGA